MGHVGCTVFGFKPQKLNVGICVDALIVFSYLLPVSLNLSGCPPTPCSQISAVINFLPTGTKPELNKQDPSHNTPESSSAASPAP